MVSPFNSMLYPSMTPPGYDQLSIVIPAFNEAAGIETTLIQVMKEVPGAEIIVVDDCSRDETGSVVQRHPQVRLIKHSFNQGQGAALKTGMIHATRKYVAWFDADNEHRTDDLKELYKAATENSLVAVIGQRTNASATLVRGMGKWLIRLLGRGLKINAGADLNCGLRIFRRDIILRYTNLIPDRFSASMMTTLIMLERKYPLAFVPVQTNQRIGHSTVRLKDGFEAILWLLRAVMLFAPIRIFLPLGLLLFLFGSVYSVTILYLYNNGLPAAGILLILSGILSVMLGLIADQISQMRLNQLPTLQLHNDLID